MSKKLPLLTSIGLSMGADPEFFFRNKANEVIGSEKVLPKDGLVANTGIGAAKFTIDGVQAELNPAPSGCREILSSGIQGNFRVLSQHLAGKDIKVDFSRAVEISKENLMELSEGSRVFGCSPSLSIYENPPVISDVNPLEYRIRAAGGHIHLGKGQEKLADGSMPGVCRALTDDHVRTVHMLDLLVGNTCVLIDRDEGNVERRKLYGRAGEFRLPKHGLEYRTPSNFWLTAYPLLSFVFGMARFTVALMASPEHDLYYKEFMSRVKAKDIADAINNNDFDQAMDNFKSIEDLIIQVTGGASPNQNWTLAKDSMKEFHYFVNTITEHGLEHWFKEDPMKHWEGQYRSRGGAEYFLRSTVREAMLADEKKTKEAERAKSEGFDGIEIIYADSTNAAKAVTKGRTRRVA